MHSHDNALKRGTIIGTYKIKKVLGEGGLGHVYRGTDEISKHAVAIKVISAPADHPDLAQKFIAAGKALAHVHHPNVASIYTSGEEGKYQYVVMEYVDGKNFNELIKLNGAMPLHTAVPYFRQILEGLRALHMQGVIHQDLKLKNLILRSDGVIKIVDFDIGRVEGQGLVGIIHYLAPEIIHGEAATVASDIWSLGVIFYEMLTGKKPFQAGTWVEEAQKITSDELNFDPEVRDHIPEGLLRIISKMCSKLNWARYQNVNDILQDLRTVESRDMATTLVTSSAKEITMETSAPKDPFDSIGPWRWDVNETSWTSWAVVGLFVVLLGGVFFLPSLFSSKQEAPSKVVSNPAPEAPVEGQKMVLHDFETVRFVWAGQIEPDYFLQVSKDAEFESLIFEVPFTSSPYMSETKMDEGHYYWRLVKKAPEGITPLFEPIHFTVVNLNAPALTYPHSQAVVPDTTNLQFYWTAKEGIGRYRFQIATDLTFEHLVKDSLVDTTQVGPIVLIPDIYYWRVRGEEPPSVTTLWSEIRSLRIPKMLARVEVTPAPTLAPVPVQQVAPVQEQVVRVTKPQPELPAVYKTHSTKQKKLAARKKKSRSRDSDSLEAKVEAKPAPVARTVEVAKPAPAAPIATTAVVPAPVVIPPTQRRVASLPAPAPKAAPAPVQRQARQDLIKLKLPPNGVSIVSLSGSQDPISFRWQNVASANGYRFEIASDADFKKIVYTSRPVKNQLVLKTILPQGKLYWRVRAMVGNSWGDWSNPFSFDLGK